jgi:hypothetical protein
MQNATFAIFPISFLADRDDAASSLFPILFPAEPAGLEPSRRDACTALAWLAAVVAAVYCSSRLHAESAIQSASRRAAGIREDHSHNEILMKFFIVLWLFVLYIK